MLVNSRECFHRGRGNIHGHMEQSVRVSGRKEKCQEKE